MSYSAQHHLDEADGLILVAEGDDDGLDIQEREFLLARANAHSLLATAQAQVAAAVAVGAL